MADELYGPPPPPKKNTNTSYSLDLDDSGTILQVAGALSSAAGAYYQVQAAQYQAKSRALSLQFSQQLSHLNARNAERDAQQEILAGQREAGRTGLAYRQIKGEAQARQAAAGIQGGVGSAGEVAASIELANQQDQTAITRNSVRAANAARAGRVNAENQARMTGVSAENVRASGKSLNPALAGATSLIGSAAQVARSNYAYQRSK